ncbi:hypothetical protein A4G28_14760 [Mycobacterium ostraviense]|uniref:Uncharacterized protein n=1 Tax=Mycobacterium ostraviense TaxID=2738409 RepID=A0A162DVH0_9MYCO|nr:hypothetical protein A4G28_14760 [Mycobacterium ostraviense]
MVLADDVRREHWTTPSERASAPWLQPRSDKDGVAEFFRMVGTFEVREFTVRSMMANQKQVVAEIVMEAAVPGGGHFHDEELHLWTFDAPGKFALCGTMWTPPNTSPPLGAKTPPGRGNPLLTCGERNLRPVGSAAGCSRTGGAAGWAPRRVQHPP